MTRLSRRGFPAARHAFAPRLNLPLRASAAPMRQLRATTCTSDIARPAVTVKGLPDGQGRSGLTLDPGKAFRVNLGNGLAKEATLPWQGQHGAGSRRGRAPDAAASPAASADRADAQIRRPCPNSPSLPKPLGVGSPAAPTPPTRNSKMIRFAILTVLALPFSAQAQQAIPLADLMSETHIHGIAAGMNGLESATLATHHGIFSVDLAAQTAVPVGSSPDDFMGFSPVPDKPGHAFASGHPATGGNLGVIRTEDGGKSWTHVSDGIGGPVDFHNMEVSRADAAVIYGISHDGAVQRSGDAGASWSVAGTAPDNLIDIATSAVAPDHLYAATETGLFESRDAGASWQSLLASTAPVSTIDMGADGRLRAVQLGQGLIEIDRASGKPTIVAPTLPGGYLLTLSVTHVDPLRLMALSPDGALLLSDDAGANWRAAVD